MVKQYQFSLYVMIEYMLYSGFVLLWNQVNECQGQVNNGQLHREKMSGKSRRSGRGA